MDSVIDTGHDQDFLVYTIVFVYRQHLELHLKHAIHLGRLFHGDGRGRPVDTHTDTDAIRADLEEFGAPRPRLLCLGIH